jgi:hypothetical protein
MLHVDIYLMGQQHFHHIHLPVADGQHQGHLSHLAVFSIDILKVEKQKDDLNVILGLQRGQSSEHNRAVESTVQLIHLTDTLSTSDTPQEG